MLTPKSSHLVERATERLLRSGALEESAAQLLVKPGRRTDGGIADGTEARAVPAAPVLPRHMVPPATLRNHPSGLGHGGCFRRHAPPAQDLRPPRQPHHFPRLPFTARRGACGNHRTRLPCQPIRWAIRSRARRPIDAVALERAGMIDWSRTRTRISEEFRLVQRQIIRAAFGPGAEPGFSNLLMVTSARPGEGKSFVATNLAGSIARQGDHPVLLVDADFKRDLICHGLGLAQARGLLDLAADPKLDPAPLIVKTPIERLSVLPVGRERERSAELFSIERNDPADPEPGPPLCRPAVDPGRAALPVHIRSGGAGTGRWADPVRRRGGPDPT